MTEKEVTTFEPITSQEDFNKKIAERLKREREKFSDYETLKNDSEKYRLEVLTLEERVQKAEEQLKESKSEAEKLIAEKQKLELKDLKRLIAIEKGIPLELSERLIGTDEDTLRKDADNFAVFSDRKIVLPRKDTEPKAKNRDIEIYGNLL